MSKKNKNNSKVPDSIFINLTNLFRLIKVSFSNNDVLELNEFKIVNPDNPFMNSFQVYNLEITALFTSKEYYNKVVKTKNNTNSFKNKLLELFIVDKFIPVDIQDDRIELIITMKTAVCLNY